MLSRRAVVAAGAAMLVASSAAWAQEPGRTYRLGYMSGSPRGFLTDIVMGELRRAGFVEGVNVSIVGEFGVTPDRADAAAATIVRAGPDVIYTAGPALIRAMQRATKTIPMAVVSDDLIAEQLVDSLAHPGGNTTGVSILATELDGKRQGILIEMLPGIRRIAALVDTSTTAPARLQALSDAAASRGVTLSIHRADRVQDIVPAIDEARADGAQALNVLASSFLYAHHTQIIEHVATAHLPSIYQWPEWAKEGALVAYGPRITSIYRQQLAPQLVKLLRGAKAADIPVEQPSVFELVLNLKTAKALDLAVSRSFIASADEVIE